LRSAGDPTKVPAVRRNATFLVAAALLHAGIPLVARLVIHPSSASLATTTPLHPMEVVEIPIEPLNEPPPVEPRAPSDTSTAPEPRAAAAAPRTPSGAVEPSAGPEPAATAVPNAPPGRAPDQYDALPEGPGDGIVRTPGLGGPIWALPGTIPEAPRAAAAPTVAPSARPVDKDIAGIVVRQAMLENDRRLGIDLPGGGTVASAIGTAVRGTETPSVGRATFEVRLSADGRVLGVRVLSASGGGADAWDRAAKAAAAALAGRSLQMNSNYAKGALVYVDASSTMALPSGGTSGVSHEGSGMRFDVSDIGAHKSRSVKTSFRVVAVH
jgi:hypothetical protein